MRPFLWHYLRELAPVPEDREDVTNQVLMRIWSHRAELEFHHLSAWWAYVAKVARRTALNRMAQSKPAAELNEETAPTEDPDIEAACWLAEEKERMYAAADEIWLGAPICHDSYRQSARVLAAQWYFIDHIPVKEILELLPEGIPCSMPLLATWLADADLCLQMAFAEVYRSNDQLTAYLLRPVAPLSPAELEEAVASAFRNEPHVTLGEWTPLEARIVIRRYRNAMFTEKIVQTEPTSDLHKVTEILHRATAALPFGRLARKIKAIFSAAGLTPPPLERPILYRRLAFQYFASDELPHRQILERALPVAEVGNQHLTPAMLNAWLSNGRLFTQIAEHIKERGPCR